MLNSFALSIAYSFQASNSVFIRNMLYIRMNSCYFMTSCTLQRKDIKNDGQMCVLGTVLPLIRQLRYKPSDELPAFCVTRLHIFSHFLTSSTLYKQNWQLIMQNKPSFVVKISLQLPSVIYIPSNLL